MRNRLLKITVLTSSFGLMAGLVAFKTGKFNDVIHTYWDGVPPDSLKKDSTGVDSLKMVTSDSSVIDEKFWMYSSKSMVISESWSFDSTGYAFDSTSIDSNHRKLDTAKVQVPTKEYMGGSKSKAIFKYESTDTSKKKEANK